MNEETLSHDFDGDQTKRPDAFGRASFAATIARHVYRTDHAPGIVIGIEGEWGCGKTFLLDLVRRELQKRAPAPIVVDLNPWMISGSESMVASLLAQLAGSIGADRGDHLGQGMEAGRKLLGYMSAFIKVARPASLLVDQSGFLAGLLRIGGSAVDTTEATREQIGKVLSTADLNSRRQQVIDALEDLASPVVVVVDDLDRVPANEIRVMFQAIKAVADFPRITYLVAYDPAIVDAALDGNGPARVRYREKIIQVAFSVPHLHVWDREKFLFDRLDEILQVCLGGLPPFVDRVHYEKAVSIVARLCVHPRDIVRLGNRLRVCLAVLENNIDTADLVVIEALAQRFPGLSEAIREHQEDFSGAIHSLVTLDEEEVISRGYADIARTHDTPPEWARHLKKLSKAEKKLATKACVFLFGESQESGLRGTFTRYRPIGEPHLLGMYCAMAQADGVPSPAAIQKLLGDPAKLNAAIADGEEFERLLPWIARFIPLTPLPDIHATLDALIEASSKCPPRGPNSKNFLDLLGTIWSDLLVVVSDSEDVRKAFQNIVATAPLSLSIVPVLRAAQEHGLLKSRMWNAVTENERFVRDAEVVKDCIAAWREKVAADAATGKLQNEPFLKRILWRWHELPGSSPAEVRHFVEQICSTAEGLDILWRPFRNDSSDGLPDIQEVLPWIWDIDGFIAQVRNFSLEKQYQGLCDKLCSEEVINSHKQLKGETAADNGGAPP